ncbi:MAG: DUF1566 domain-containing protein [Candidatus Electrothrix sp. AW5]|nr:DUF1566 domain-containing protein [Candidatus Electrothrix gigas]
MNSQLSTLNFQLSTLIILCCVFFAASVHAAPTCETSSIPASTPNSQLIDNGDGTITDSKTGLMWKTCSEGQIYSSSPSSDCTGTATTFTWQGALKQPGVVNASSGFAGYTDWRLPNLKELRSIVEEQCYDPAINATRFPNTPSSFVWSGSPYADYSDYAWSVNFSNGHSDSDSRNDSDAVRLVRGGQ